MQLATADGVERVHQTPVSPDVAANVASPLADSTPSPIYEYDSYKQIEITGVGIFTRLFNHRETIRC